MADVDPIANVQDDLACPPHVIRALDEVDDGGPTIAHLYGIIGKSSDASNDFRNMTLRACPKSGCIVFDFIPVKKVTAKTILSHMASV